MKCEISYQQVDVRLPRELVYNVMKSVGNYFKWTVGDNNDVAWAEGVYDNYRVWVFVYTTEQLAGKVKRIRITHQWKFRGEEE